MNDNIGLFYYPFPTNKNVRMYVRESDGAIFFRMWNREDPDLWVEHGWVPHEAIQMAASIYSGKNFQPTQAYDINLARELLREATESKESSGKSPDTG